MFAYTVRKYTLHLYMIWHGESSFIQGAIKVANEAVRELQWLISPQSLSPTSHEPWGLNPEPKKPCSTVGVLINRIGLGVYYTNYMYGKEPPKPYSNY